MEKIKNANHALSKYIKNWSCNKVKNWSWTSWRVFCFLEKALLLGRSKAFIQFEMLKWLFFALLCVTSVKYSTPFPLLQT